MRQYNAQGVTTIYENHGMEAAHIEGYRALRAADALTLRVAVAQEAESYGLPWSRPKTARAFIRDCERAAESIELQDEFFRFLGMSLMRDGSCWPGTIRMHDPYLGPYGQLTEGVEYISKERAALTMHMCGSCGMRLNTVVMGTRAHEENLEQLEAAARVLDVPSLHWILVHAWFLEPEQARRYARLGMDVTTSMAFTWAKGKLFRSRMKPSVLADLVPLRRILDSGLVVAGKAWSNIARIKRDLWSDSFVGLMATDRKPPQLDRCHALDTHGTTVARFYPKWHRGADGLSDAGSSETPEAGGAGMTDPRQGLGHKPGC